MRCVKTAWLLRACSVFLIVLTTPCSCGNNGDPNGPRITSFSYVGQLPADKSTVIFSFSFTSSDGSLGAGKADFYVGDQTQPLELMMKDLLASAGVPNNATKGEVGAALRFTSSVPSGSAVNLALQLIDAQGRHSNRAEVTLQITY